MYVVFDWKFVVDWTLPRLQVICQAKYIRWFMYGINFLKMKFFWFRWLLLNKLRNLYFKLFYIFQHKREVKHIFDIRSCTGIIYENLNVNLNAISFDRQKKIKVQSVYSDEYELLHYYTCFQLLFEVYFMQQIIRRCVLMMSSVVCYCSCL